MTIDMDTLYLARGGHSTRAGGVCLLEAVAWFAGEDHSDHPPCVSPVLGACGRELNDVLPDVTRQQLVPLIPALPGTAGDGKDETRGFMAMDWLLRVYVPAWCDLVPALAADAATLRGLPRVADPAVAKAAYRVLSVVRGDAAAAGDAARAVAGAAAVDAAGPAARDAARAAAGLAAAAWAAAGPAARDAARDAARAVAGAAAVDAAWAAAGPAAGHAARAAAKAVLAPTVTRLQTSAIQLFAALIAGEWPDDVQ